MRVLFVCSGKNGSVGEIVQNQGNSLIRSGIELDYFIINPGIWGYISTIPKIRRKYINGKYDLIHAHYSLSAIVSSLAGRFPLVASIMGSDVYMFSFFRLVTIFFSRYRWNTVIVKSQRLKETIRSSTAYVIPNGVDLDRFICVSKSDARKVINYPSDKYIVVFIASRYRSEKNYQLAKEAISLINNDQIELRDVCNYSNELVPYYLNAADVLLLTSKWEGSPNVIKEAMACNCPIVATDVGDIKWIVGETEGCYITSFSPEDIADKIKAAIAFGRKTNGRERIIMLGLTSKSVASKIIEVYNKVIAIR